MNARTGAIQIIQDEVCCAYGVSPMDLVSARRHIYVTRPRQIAMHLCRRMTPFSFAQIGRRFNRDHTTIVYGDNKILDLRAADPAFNARVKAIEDKLRPVLTADVETDAYTEHLMHLLSRAIHRSVRRNPSATLKAILDAIERLDQEPGP